jgi:hypothetical protein
VEATKNRLQDGRILCLAFPYDCGRPANTFELSPSFAITVDVPLKLWNPIVLARRWNSGSLATAVPMPKTSVHEYNQFPLRKHQVWRAREIFAMQPETKSQGVSKSSHC